MAVSRKVYDDYLEYVARCDADGDEAVPFDQYRLMVGPPAVATEKPTNPKDAVGIKKTPFSVLPTPVLVEAALGMAEGALKYGRHNYRAIGVRTSVYYDATMRHLTAYWEGEDIDPESGLSHLAKAISSLMVLRDAQLHGKCTDDRPPPSPDLFVEANKRMEELLVRHADKNPKHYTHDNYKEDASDQK